MAAAVATAAAAWLPASTSTRPATKPRAQLPATVPTMVVEAAQAPATARDTGRTTARAPGLDTYLTTAGQEGATRPTMEIETVDTDQTTTDPARSGQCMGGSHHTREAPAAPEDHMAPTDVLRIRAVEASPTWSRCSEA